MNAAAIPTFLAAFILALAGCSDAVQAPAAADTTSHAFQARTFVIGEPGSTMRLPGVPGRSPGTRGWGG